MRCARRLTDRPVVRVDVERGQQGAVRCAHGRLRGLDATLRGEVVGPRVERARDGLFHTRNRQRCIWNLVGQRHQILGNATAIGNSMPNRGIALARPIENILEDTVAELGVWIVDQGNLRVRCLSAATVRQRPSNASGALRRRTSF